MSEKGSYRRIGVVTARRLQTGTTWRTANGELLQAKAGDWLVFDQSGGERVIANCPFLATHKLLSGDSWERCARVEARRAKRAESVMTLEGPVEALPGDWIVTDESGNTWPVPDSHFRTSYVVSTDD